MGSYEFQKIDEDNYLVHYTGDGWVTTKMNAEEVKRFKKENNFEDFEWR